MFSTAVVVVVVRLITAHSTLLPQLVHRVAERVAMQMVQRILQVCQVSLTVVVAVVRDAPAWMPAEVHGGHRTVAIRVPDHPVARGLAEAFGGLIAATSANRSGEPPAAAAHELGALADDPRVLVIDGGPTQGGAPSTLVDVRGSQPICLREGAVAWSRVLNSLHP